MKRWANFCAFCDGGRARWTPVGSATRSLPGRVPGHTPFRETLSHGRGRVASLVDAPAHKLGDGLSDLNPGRQITADVKAVTGPASDHLHQVREATALSGRVTSLQTL